MCWSLNWLIPRMKDMDILVLGGTRFVGLHIVEAFVAAGHQVTVLTRGQAQPTLPPGVEQLVGDRDEGPGGLAALGQRRWDACVDVSGYQPRQVRASTHVLRDRVDRYVFISTGSVYAEQHRQILREDDPLLPAYPGDHAEISFETYGPLKVACERLVQAAFPESFTVLRPQLVVGPQDYSARYAYWPDRAARGGTVLAPGDGQDFFQVIDARDHARFAVTVVEQRVSGIFNMAGPRLFWSEFLSMLGIQDVRWASVDELDALNVSIYDFPGFLPRANNPQSGMNNVDNSAALAVGLTLTDPARTARDTRAWSQDAGKAYALTPEREADILADLGKLTGSSMQ